ncbi:MAG: thioredoxin family protein [Phycisphaera sp.]|nr:MAG: thioredoxin family protein [Phycisphaera sp.]
MRNLTVVGVVAILIGLMIPNALAQPMGFGGDDSVAMSAKAWWAPRQADEGALVAMVAVTMDHPSGLHSWPSADQDVLPEDVAAFAIRTEVSVTTGGAVLSIGEIQWPSPKPYPVPDPTGMGDPIEVPVYSGAAVVFVPVLIDREAASEARTLEMVVSYQACNETVCFPPEDADVVASLPAFGSGEAPAEASAIESSTIDNAIALAVMSGSEVVDGAEVEPESTEMPAGDAEAASPPGSADTQNKFLGIIAVPSPESAGGIVGIMLMGILGGFVLNLTPCVLPVIPIKVMTLSQHAGSPGKTLMLGVWMALGVVAFWVGLGVPAAFLSKAVGAIFGIWWFTFGVGVIIAIMSIGLMGLFTMQLPQSVYKVNPKADSPWGSFVFGVMTGVLGLPCFGLVAGALLAAAAAFPSHVTMLIFGSLGVGMALPYLILSLNPKWVAVIPRTGPASELVKQVMGLLLLGAAGYFIASGLQALILDMPWIGRQLHWWAAAVFVAIACLWLAVRTMQITKSLPKRGVFGVLGLVVAVGVVLFALDVTGSAKEDYIEREARIAEARGEGGADAILTSTWVDYSPDLLARAREEGFVVVVDFTADWCINCKALEKQVLGVEPVHSRLRDDDVVMMKADLTSTRLPGWDLMRELNQKAPPVLAIYGPGIDGTTPWMSNAYDTGTVMNAIALGKGEQDAQEVAKAN